MRPLPAHLLLIAFIAGPIIVAERIFDDLLFTPEKCKDLGYANDFEACAVIEFCTDLTLGQRVLSEDEWWTDEEDPSDSETVAESSQLADEKFVVEVGEAEAESFLGEQQGQHNPGSVPPNHPPPPKENQHITGANTSATEYPIPAQVDTNTTLPEYPVPVHSQNTPPQISPNQALPVPERSSSPNDVPETVVSSPFSARFGWRVPGSAQCLYPGPVLRLKRGAKHGLFAKGSAEAATNLHFHGLHVAGHGNGDELQRSVRDGTIIYELNLPADKHHGGTHWYHSHLQGAALEQVKGGAFGMIVIDENGHNVGTEDDNVLGFLDNEKIMILDNTQGSNKWTANGVEGEIFSLVKDEWYRMRVLAMNMNSHSDLEDVVFPETCTVYAIAHDGIFRFTVPAAKPQKIFTLTSASRLDIAIQCSDNGEVKISGNSVASIHVDSSKEASSVSPFESGSNHWKSSRLEYTKDLREVAADNEWKVRVDETSINEIGEHEHKPLCDSNGNDFQYGTVQSWKISGADTHPFHVHMYPMQVVNDLCGEWHDIGEYYDTIVTDGHCEVKLHFVDIAGPTVVHCHIFEHAEQGALGWLNVVGGPMLTGPTCADGECVEAEARPMCSEARRNLRSRYNI